MHKSAMENGVRFFVKYPVNGIIVDVGAQDVNGSLRSVAPLYCKYIGVDCTDGKGVDLLMPDPYAIPLANEFADAVVSTSCFEHVEFFWLLFLEMIRVVKVGGYIYIDAPSAGPFHAHPVDCWRFYPQAGLALQKWAERQGYSVKLVETYTLDTGEWNDWVAIFQKEKE